MLSEDRAIEGLTSLADELADDPRVHKIVCEAIDKLRGRPCRPHWWRLPVVGDEALVCDECGRRLAFAMMTPDTRSSIVDGFERRHGDEAVSDFLSALRAVESARRPKVESKPCVSNFKTNNRQRVELPTLPVSLKPEVLHQEPYKVLHLRVDPVEQVEDLD